MLRIIDLGFKYRSTTALDRINLSIQDGESILLTGANGSGKTTLLKILAGLLPIQTGKILYDDKELSQEDLKFLCGYVFHNPINQIIGSTVEEDVAFGLENMGVPKNTMHKEVERVLQEFQLYELKDKDPVNLSAGQAQKLAIASVVVMKPKFLLLDEPTSMLDSKGCMQVIEMLKALNQMNITLIISTHEIYQFANLAKRVIHLSNGTVDFDGSFSEFMTSSIDDVEK
ncbi:energy-coupling factor ABC transporter ATP-binding protein [Thermotoga profunda]|uniref:energy-coupling factor ABC transporter ATP-binding protein n=1 Tax=Thermotoga profunda TaxID=1508420 RepID=UPI0005972A19|nr:ABC transporter ATP-binding protein [Thermotoga profunda]